MKIFTSVREVLEFYLKTQISKIIFLDYSFQHLHTT